MVTRSLLLHLYECVVLLFCAVWRVALVFLRVCSCVSSVICIYVLLYRVMMMFPRPLSFTPRVFSDAFSEHLSLSLSMITSGRSSGSDKNKAITITTSATLFLHAMF